MGFRQDLNKFGLKVVRIGEINLHDTYVQARPNDPLPFTIQHMPQLTFSPHYDAASRILEKGEDWFKENWRNTRYGKLLKHFGKNNYPEKLPKLIRSMQKGYLRKGHEEDYIIVLQDPFAVTRYLRHDISRKNSPEIFSGHHRAGVLLALGNSTATVVIAKDNKPGSLFSNGKIHDLCRQL